MPRCAITFCMKKMVMCYHIDRAPQEVAVEELTFRPSVYGVIIQDGSILLSPQWDGYDFPGGAIDLGETIEEALVREVREETGLTARIGKLLHVQNDFFLHPISLKPFHSILIFYSCKDISGKISTDGFSGYEKDVVKAAEWIPVERAVTLKFINSVDSAALIRLAMSEKGL